jgi:hypothetical protein
VAGDRDGRGFNCCFDLATTGLTSSGTPDSDMGLKDNADKNAG